MKWKSLIINRIGAAFAVSLLMVSCSSSPDAPSYIGEPINYGPQTSTGVPKTGDNNNTSRKAANTRNSYKPAPISPERNAAALYKQVNIKKNLIPAGRHGRKVKRYMKPRYITIHSTQNYSPSADAWQHAKALNNGKLKARKRRGGNRIGYLTWHFSTDDTVAVQHLPTNEQGEHADFDGPGNKYSIGIEMCENRGNSRSGTIERTAKLAAYLMYKHKIPLKKVVPHYHWPRGGVSPAHKNCPHYLLDNGKPGAKWRGFQAKVNKHYKAITSGRSIDPETYNSSGYASSSRSSSGITPSYTSNLPPGVTRSSSPTYSRDY